MDELENYFTLNPGEFVVKKTESSTLGLVMTWLCAPVTLITLFLITYLPPLFSMLASSAARQAAAEALGLSDGSEVNVASYVFEQVFGFIPGFAWVLISIPLVGVILAWLIWCLLMTYRHFQYKFVMTNQRVLGVAKGELLEAKLDEVKNANIEQSIWGNLFRYGAVTVQTTKGTLTFYNIHKPQEIYRAVLDQASEYCAH